MTYAPFLSRQPLSFPRIYLNFKKDYAKYNTIFNT